MYLNNVYGDECKLLFLRPLQIEFELHYLHDDAGACILRIPHHQSLDESARSLFAFVLIAVETHSHFYLVLKMCRQQQKHLANTHFFFSTKSMCTNVHT